MISNRMIAGSIVLFCFLLFVSFCSAERYYQKDNLFSVDVPEGWSAKEKPGSLIVTNPKGDNGISIQFKAASIVPDRVVVQSLINTATMASNITQKLKGTVTGENEILIGGVYARKLDYTMPVSGKTAYLSYILSLNTDVGYAFVMAFSAPSETERSELEEVARSIKFQ